MAQPLAVPFSHPPSMLPAAYNSQSPLSTMARDGDTSMKETGPFKGILRIDECDDEDGDVDMQPRPAKRTRVAYHCEDCGTSYTEKRALARHRHTDQHRKKLGLPPNKKHSCIVCQKLFGRGHDLKRHYNEQHPDHAAERTTPGSTHSAEQGSSGSDCGGSEHAFSTDGAARSTASPMTAATALSIMTDERCRSSSSLPDEKPVMKFSNSPEHANTAHFGVIRKSRTMSDLRNPSSVPLIKMDQIDKMDVDDKPAPAFFDHPHLRPSASIGSLAQRSETSSRLSQYSTDQSIHTGTTESVPDLHPYMTKANIPKELALDAPLEPNNSVRPMACTMCQDAFEDDPDALLIHLRRHLGELKGEYRCHECFIGFVHEEDLALHQKCASEGNCGFNFRHIRPCTGHHPPNTSPAWIDRIPDSDSFRLCTKLRHWEQSQLRAYISEVNSLIAARKNPTFERWSVGHIMRDARNFSLISVNTYASAPCDVDEDGKHDIGGLQQRLRQMSFKRTATSVKDIIRKQRVRSSAAEQDAGTVSKHLANAISRNDLARAERSIREEGQQKAIQKAHVTLTTQALWGHENLAPFLSAHRILEDMNATCPVCRIRSSNFEEDLNKLKCLIAHGADVNEPGGLCGFPLNTAAWMGKAEVVKYLIGKGAKIESLSSPGPGSPLCIAAAQADSSGSLKVVNVLLEAGADVHFRGPEGTALELAKRRLDMLCQEIAGSVPSRGDHPVRSAWCHKTLELLANAERCSTPPMTGTLYCQDASISPGVATFRSFRQPTQQQAQGRRVIC